MKKISYPLLTLLALAATTAFIETLQYRLAALFCTIAPALCIAVRQQAAGRQGQERAGNDLVRQLADHSETLPRLAVQLHDVVQQTEQAVLELNERFLNIVERARRQLTTTTEVLTARPDRGPDEREGEQRELLAAVTMETAMLSRDVQGAIVSLQFQDLTKQHIERVIDQLEHMQREIELMRVQLQDRSAADRVDRRTPCAVPGRPGRTGEA